MAVSKGDKGVGVSNSLGSSSLDILLSLGVPWFIGNLLNWTDLNTMPSIQISSVGTEYTVLLLLISVISLYAVLNCAQYRLQRSVGITLSIIYLILITISILFEMNVFFPSVSMWILILTKINTKIFSLFINKQRPLWINCTKIFSLLSIQCTCFNFHSFSNQSLAIIITTVLVCSYAHSLFWNRKVKNSWRKQNVHSNQCNYQKEKKGKRAIRVK